MQCDRVGSSRIRLTYARLYELLIAGDFVVVSQSFAERVQTRVLNETNVTDYNCGDVEATFALREWMASAVAPGVDDLHAGTFFEASLHIPEPVHRDD